MSYPYSDYVKQRGDFPPLLVYVVGSTGFRLNTRESDIDLFHVDLDIKERLDITKSNSMVTSKYEYPESRTTPKIEIDYMELGAFIHAVHSGSSLKAVEAAWMNPVHKNMSSEIEENLFSFLKRPREQYVDMYMKEVNRRYRKVFYKDINPNAKNYNINAGFDTKEACHLFRVVHGAFKFMHDGNIKTDYEDLRRDIWGIRNGSVSYKQLLEHFSTLISQLEQLAPVAKSQLYFPKDEDPQTIYTRLVYRSLQLSAAYGTL